MAERIHSKRDRPLPESVKESAALIDRQVMGPTKAVQAGVDLEEAARGHLHNEKGATAARVSWSDTDPRRESERALWPRSHAIAIANTLARTVQS